MTIDTVGSICIKLTLVGTDYECACQICSKK